MKSALVIGSGGIARRHCENIKRLLPDVSLTNCPSRPSQTAASFQNVDHVVSRLPDIECAQFDFAVVASPASLHLEHAEHLVKNNVPVLVEKPLSMNSEEAARFITLTDPEKVPVGVGYCVRHLASTKAVKELLINGEIGIVRNVISEVGHYLPSWRPEKDYRETVSAQKSLGGGVLMELSHELDFLMWLFGPLSIEHGKLRSSAELNLDVEDSADLVLEGANKTQIYVHMDFLQRRAVRKCRLLGSGGLIDWNLLDNTVRVERYSPQTFETLKFETGSNEMYLQMLREFFALVRGEANSSVTVAEAAQTVAIIQELKNRFGPFERCA